MSASDVLTWSYDDDGFGASAYAGGDKEWSMDGGSSWSTTTTSDQLFRCRDATASPDLIVLVGDRIADGSGVASVWAYDKSGVLQWTYDTGSNTLDVVIDSNNDVYVCGQAGNDGSGTKNLWKFDSLGNKLAGRYVRSTTYAWDLALDSLGRIIVGTGNGASRVAKSFANEEVIVSTGTIGGIAVDLNDNSIYLGSGGTPVNLRKYNSSLGLDWQQDPSTSSAVTDIAIMSNQRVVISMNYSAGKKICYSWDKDGNNQLDYDGGITTNADSVAVDGSDNVYLVTSDTATKTFVKLNSSLVEQDYLDHGTILRRVVVASGDSKPYTVGIRKGSVLCWKYDSGALEDTIQCPTDEIEGIAISSGAYVIPPTVKNDYNLISSGAINFQGTNWRAQTFTATGNYNIIGLKLGFYRQGSPGDTTIAIRAVDGGTGKPTGADLAISTFDSDVTTATTGEWRYFGLSTPLSLINGTQYAIIMRTPTGNLFNRLLCRADISGGNPYPGGACYDSNDSGASWTIDNVRELGFETIKLVIIPPTITDESTSSETIAGAQVDLFVTATGDPAPTYQWYKNDVAISGATSSTLTIYPFVTATYKCKVTNVGGEAWSNDMVITVKPNPYRYNPYNLPLDSERIT